MDDLVRQLENFPSVVLVWSGTYGRWRVSLKVKHGEYYKAESIMGLDVATSRALGKFESAYIPQVDSR